MTKEEFQELLEINTHYDDDDNEENYFKMKDKLNIFLSKYNSGERKFTPSVVELDGNYRERNYDAHED